MFLLYPYYTAGGPPEVEVFFEVYAGGVEYKGLGVCFEGLNGGYMWVILAS